MGDTKNQYIDKSGGGYTDLGDDKVFQYSDSNFPNKKISYNFNDQTKVRSTITSSGAYWTEKFEYLTNLFLEKNAYYHFAKRGTTPNFTKQLFYSETAGTYYLYRSDYRLYITNSDGGVLNEYYPSDFKDGVIPKCIIAILQGAGGGGHCANTNGGQKDSSGGGGGSGTCIGCVIDITSYSCYTLIVGAGGSGGYWFGYSSPTIWKVIAASDGTNTYITKGYNGGGIAAMAPAGYAGKTRQGGSGGGDGTVNSGSAWWLPCFDSGGTYYGSSSLQGVTGSGGGAASGTGNYTLTTTSDTSYNSKSANRKSVGGQSGGSAGYKDWGGAGAGSYLGPGGKAGDAGGNGSAGGRGGGGGGAPGTFIGRPSGGKGGDGVIWLWY